MASSEEDLCTKYLKATFPLYSIWLSVMLVIILSLPMSKASESLAVNIQHIHIWSELFVPLVNTIKEGSENKPAILFLFILYFLNHENITFH